MPSLQTKKERETKRGEGEQLIQYLRNCLMQLRNKMFVLQSRGSGEENPKGSRERESGVIFGRTHRINDWALLVVTFLYGLRFITTKCENVLNKHTEWISV